MERGHSGLAGRYCTTAAPHPLPTSQSSSHFTPPRLPLLPTSHCCPHPTPLHLPLLSTSHESPPPRPLSHAYTMPILGFPHCSHTAHCGTHLLPYSPPPTLLLTSYCRTPYPPIDKPYSLVLAPISTTPPLSSLILVSLDSPLQPHFHTPLLPLPTPSHCFLLAPPLPSCTPLLLQALLGEGFDQDRS